MVCVMIKNEFRATMHPSPEVNSGPALIAPCVGLAKHRVTAAAQAECRAGLCFGKCETGCHGAGV